MTEREKKITALIESLAKSPEGIELLRGAMSTAGLAVLRQVEGTPFPEVTDPDRIASAKEGIVLDCETTGLVPVEEGVTQLSMYKILYDDQGILNLGKFFDRYNDPGRPIPANITELTGITDEQVKGQLITDQEIADWVGDAEMAVAHNAEFDRKMLEHHFPDAGFDQMRWDCSMKQVDWKGRMMGGSGLEMLALKNGMVYGSHNAANDIRALAFVLNAPGAEGRPSGFVEMMDQGNQGFIHIIAKGSRFETKDALKENGYNFAGADEPVNGHSKVWHKQVPNREEDLAAEAEFLSSNAVFGRDVSLPAFHITGKSAYSKRTSDGSMTFKTSEAKTVMDALRQHEVDPDQVQSSLQF